MTNIFSRLWFQNRGQIRNAGLVPLVMLLCSFTQTTQGQSLPVQMVRSVSSSLREINPARRPRIGEGCYNAASSPPDDQRRELFSQNNPAIVKHGATRGGKLTCTYNSWMSAKRRCTDQKYHKYSDYGGRGIRMCERWLHNFENFLADMSERPPRRTLDRFPNPNGNYEPGNCRWATAKEQRDNRGR